MAKIICLSNFISLEKPFELLLWHLKKKREKQIKCGWFGVKQLVGVNILSRLLYNNEKSRCTN